MNKLITFVTKVRKIWDLDLTREEADSVVDKAFAKYDKDKSNSLQVKDLLMEIWEVYKAKKLK